MASRRSSGAGPSVISRGSGIRTPLILAIVAVGAVALATSYWNSTSDESATARKPEPASPDWKEEKKSPQPRAEAKEAPLPPKLLDEAKKLLPKAARPKQVTKREPPKTRPEKPAKKALPLPPPTQPRPTKQSAAVVAKRSLADLRKAAKAGEAEGQYQLGRAYLAGAGVKADRIEAAAWFILAAARGHGAAAEARDKHLAGFKRDERISVGIKARNLGPIIPGRLVAGPGQRHEDLAAGLVSQRHLQTATGSGQ